MKNNQIIKQAVDFQRNTFNNAFQAVVLFQDQVERASNTVLAQANIVPEEGKKMIATWTVNYKKGLEQYKEAVDTGFNRIAELVGVPH